MGLPGLNQGVIAVDVGTEAFSEAVTTEPPKQGPDSALTATAIMAVSFTGAGFWYLLWKLALHLVAGR